MAEGAMFLTHTERLQGARSRSSKQGTASSEPFELNAFPGGAQASRHATLLKACQCYSVSG